MRYMWNKHYYYYFDWSLNVQNLFLDHLKVSLWEERIRDPSRWMASGGWDANLSLSGRNILQRMRCWQLKRWTAVNRGRQMRNSKLIAWLRERPSREEMWLFRMMSPFIMILNGLVNEILPSNLLLLLDWNDLWEFCSIDSLHNNAMISLIRPLKSYSSTFINSFLKSCLSSKVIISFWKQTFHSKE